MFLFISHLTVPTDDCATLELLRNRCIGRYAPEHSTPIAMVIDGGLGAVSAA